jgi:hypothetical protein
VADAVSNLMLNENRLVAKMADKHENDLEQNYRMAAHQFIMIEDVDQL